MTIEKRLKRLTEDLAKDNKKYDLIGIYEDEHAFDCYKGHMSSGCADRHMIYPVSWNKEIKSMGSVLSGHVAAFFFGTRFLNDETFIQEIVNVLNIEHYDPEKIQIYSYSIE